MKKSIQTMVAVISIWTVSPSDAAVWETRNQWSSKWEKAYEHWVATEWNKNYFTQNNAYKGLKMDCADLVYAMRAIFAAENGLPFAINDPTGSGNIISNRMTRFDGMTSQQRKRAFVAYLYGVTSTKSLPRDSYPPRVNRNDLTSGSFLLTDEKSHHAWTVKKFLPTGVPYLLFSSRPAKTVMFERLEYPTMGFTFPNGLKPETHAGFRNFKPINELKKPAWQVSGYSLEQYNIPYRSWRSEMQKRMSTRGESSEELLERLLLSVCAGTKERVVAVNEGLAQLKKITQQGRQCMNAKEYDDYSTPSRDKRLIGNFEDLVNAYYNLRSKNRLGNGKYARITTQIMQGKSTSYCELNAGVSVSLGHVVAAGLSGTLSSNPHDSLAARWGLERSGSRAKSCPTY